MLNINECRDGNSEIVRSILGKVTGEKEEMSHIVKCTSLCVLS